ncbi:hypothetical protein EVAR_83580_1 [Eumeta japonica]|uniref:Uncharacterized protein n=1 Tax=Eumeta variegata TaxID=151549 RepID=A0A4C1UND2_EUMVA|nr:hypothetical protein EVAR_83580_1 [Eumeta japonica]
MSSGLRRDCPGARVRLLTAPDSNCAEVYRTISRYSQFAEFAVRDQYTAFVECTRRVGEFANNETPGELLRRPARACAHRPVFSAVRPVKGEHSLYCASSLRNTGGATIEIAIAY